MNCDAKKLNICRLIQNSYKSPILVFDSDISGDTFKLNIYFESTRALRKEVTGQFENENTVFFPEFSIQAKSYRYEIIRVHNSKNKLLLRGKYNITDDPTDCNCSNKSETINFTVNDENTVINFSYTETFLNVGEGGNSYSTEEIKTGGTWINGKEIYRKVFQGTNDNTELHLLLDPDYIINIDQIIDFRGRINAVGQNNTYPLNYSFAGNSSVLDSNYGVGVFNGTEFFINDGFEIQGCMYSLQNDPEIEGNSIKTPRSFDYVFIVEYTKQS